VADDVKTQQKALIASVRDSLSDAYAFVRGAQYTRQVGQTTYEQLVDAAIAKIKGTTNVQTSRPSKLQRIASIQQNLVAALQVLRSTPVEAWTWGSDQEVQDKDKANTAET